MAMAPANRPLGGLTVGAGGQMMTPQQVAEQRKVAAALMQQASDTSPVGHWTAALNRGLQGYLGGRDMFRANEAESNETARALEAFQNRAGLRQPSPVASALAGGDGFLDSIINSESGGNWNALNSEGYGGRLQFGDARLADAAAAGIIPKGVTGKLFSAMSPEKQMAVENWHFQDIENQARRMGLDQYIGQVIGGVPITMEAIKGMAHLGGIGGTARFLESGGQYNPADSNGTSLRDYGLRHGGAAAPAGAGVSAIPAAGNVSEIAALLADPWLPESARAVLQAEMNQQMQMQNAAYEMQLQNQDPLRQLQIQQAQLELQAIQNPSAPAPVFEGGQWWDVSTGQPVALSDPSVDPTSDIQNYEYYAQQASANGAEPMSFQDWKVSIERAGGQGASVGSIPQGMQLVQDPLTGSARLEWIEGSPQYAEHLRTQEQAAARDETRLETADLVLEDIGRAMDMIDSSTAGFVGNLSSGVAGTQAHDLQNLLRTVRSNIGFDRLQQMRDQSPTGGALGSITERELSELQSVLGSLEQSQSPEQLRANLQRLQQKYTEIIHGPQASQQGDEQVRYDFSSMAPADLIRFDLTDATLEEINAWNAALDAMGSK